MTVFAYVLIALVFAAWWYGDREERRRQHWRITHQPREDRIVAIWRPFRVASPRPYDYE